MLLGRAIGKNQGFAVPVNPDDLELQFPACHVLEFRFGLRVITTSSNFFACEVEKLRDWHEPTNARYIDHQAALIVIDNSCLEHLTMLIQFLRNVPCAR